MPDELKPCPWCGSPNVEAFPAHAASYAPSVLCHTCGRAVDAEDAITAWNALPRAPQWTEFDGTESTLPPTRTWICIHNNEYGARFAAQHRSKGETVDHENHTYMLKMGDRWMPWPGE